MAEALYPGGSPVRPDLAEILPVAVVEALVARSEGELRTMWLELQEIAGSAESAERRLKANRVAAVYDDAFESDVLAYVRRVVEPEAADRLSLAASDSAAIPPAWANGRSSAVEGALPPPPVVPSAPVASPPPPPPPPPGPPGGSPSDGAPTGQVQATPRSSPKPRTTVVDRGHRPSEPTHASPSAPPPPSDTHPPWPTQPSSATTPPPPPPSSPSSATHSRHGRSRPRWGTRRVFPPGASRSGAGARLDLEDPGPSAHAGRPGDGRRCPAAAEAGIAPVTGAEGVRGCESGRGCPVP